MNTEPVYGIGVKKGYGQLNITVSGGLAEGIANIDEVIKKADEALYAAKRTGKDKICF